jgi:hypothetical protein
VKLREREEPVVIWVVVGGERLGSVDARNGRRGPCSFVQVQSMARAPGR